MKRMTSMSDEKRLAVVSRICNQFATTLDVERVLHDGLRQILEIMGVEAVVVFRLNRRAGELELAAYEGVSEEFARGVDKLKLGEGLNGWVAQKGKPLVVKDASTDPRLTREVVRREGIKSMLIVPMKWVNEVKGTISIASREYREFDEVDEGFLTTVGSVICLCTENARLYREQTAVKEQLRNSERSYRELFESAHDAIWIHDLKGNILVANEAAAKLIGFSTEEIPGEFLSYNSEKVLSEPLPLNVKSFLSEEGLSLARQVRDKLLHGQALVQPYEQRIIRRDGTLATVMLTTNLVAPEGEPEAFQNIARDVTQERKMQDSMRFYLQKVLVAQEEERKRIARELHDDAGQSLLLLAHQLDAVASDSKSKLSKPVGEKLTQLHNLAVETLNGLRRYAQELRPAILDDLGLVAALEWMVDSLIAEKGLNVEVQVGIKGHNLPHEAQLLLFRIAQEALGNIRRHARASKVTLRLESEAGKIRMTITDDGQGFEVPPRISDLSGSGRLGLIGMQERAQLLGGTLRIQSEPGKGTTVTVEVPFEE